MKDKYTINNIAYWGILLTLFLTIMFSCKKDKKEDVISNPPTVQSTIHYKKISNIQQYDEAADIYVYGSIMSGPVLNSFKDTANYPSFSYEPKLTPYHITGNCSISINLDTLYLSYTSYNKITNVIKQVIKEKYLRK